MRKRSFFTGFVFVLFIGLFLTGCASIFVFDKSIPEENLSIIKIPNELTVVKFDDKKVNWKTSFSNLSLDPRALKATAKIPAGEHTLTVNYYSVLDYGTHKKITKADGIEIKFDFQPENTYVLSPVFFGDKMAIRVSKEIKFEKKTK